MKTITTAPPDAEHRAGGDRQEERGRQRDGGGDIQQDEEDRAPWPQLGELEDDRRQPVHHSRVGGVAGPPSPALRLRRGRLSLAWSAPVRTLRAPRAPAAAREDAREPLERLRRLLQSRGDLIRVGPRSGIQPFGERQQRLAPRRIGRALRNPLAHDRIPPRQERDLLVGRGAFDRRRDGRTRRAGVAAVRLRGGRSRRRRGALRRRSGRTAATSAARPRRRRRLRRPVGGACAAAVGRASCRRSAGCRGPPSSRRRCRDAALRCREARPARATRGRRARRPGCGRRTGSASADERPRGTSASDRWFRTRACRG